MHYYTNAAWHKSKHFAKDCLRNNISQCFLQVSAYGTPRTNFQRGCANRVIIVRILKFLPWTRMSFRFEKVLIKQWCTVQHAPLRLTESDFRTWTLERCSEVYMLYRFIIPTWIRPLSCDMSVENVCLCTLHAVVRAQRRNERVSRGIISQHHQPACVQTIVFFIMVMANQL